MNGSMIGNDVPKDAVDLIPAILRPHCAEPVAYQLPRMQNG